MVMDAVGDAASAIGSSLGLIKPKKAKLILVETKEEIDCMFNPTEYSLSQTIAVNRNTTPATPGGTPQYGGTSPMTLSVKLFFDDFASLKGDVTPKITKLLGWMNPTDESRAHGAPCAPRVSFHWGNKQLDWLEGFLTKVTVNYKIFRNDGTPVQAEVDIGIEGEYKPKPATNPTSHAANSRRTHAMIEGDTLQSVAFVELGKPTYWRAIAELNGIDDPLRTAPGTVLLIPSLADAAGRS
jgi:hypothetical protein